MPSGPAAQPPSRLDYSEAVAYLDGHVNQEVVGAGHTRGLSLEPVISLLGLLGDPQRSYPSIHVTGTNGKGSVCRIASALLREHGLSVGTYTSPHLAKVNERLAWDLEPISDESFAGLMGELQPLVEMSGLRLSYFELLTAAAFTWFAEVAVDVIVAEVGMLGRFDATNVLDAGVSVITNVGSDHTDRAPGWRQAILHEKAGIVRAGSALVLGAPDLGEPGSEARALLEAEEPAVIFVRGEDFDVAHARDAVGGQVFDHRGCESWLEDLFLPLHGAHQLDNATTAIMAVEAFFGRALDAAVVRDGLAGVEVPGRFEVLGRAPLVVVDGGHNANGVAAAASTLAESFDVAGRTILVAGFLQGSGRDLEEILDALEVRNAELVVACAPDSPRAVDPAEVARAVGALGTRAEVVSDPGAAVERALAVATSDDVVLVVGSLYLVEPARKAVSRWAQLGAPDGGGR